MEVTFYLEDNVLYEYECNDVSGLLAAVKETDNIHFDMGIYKYESCTLNHYTDKDTGEMVQQLAIYVEEQKPRMIKMKPSYL